METFWINSFISQCSKTDLIFNQLLMVNKPGYQEYSLKSGSESQLKPNSWYFIILICFIAFSITTGLWCINFFYCSNSDKKKRQSGKRDEVFKMSLKLPEPLKALTDINLELNLPRGELFVFGQNDQRCNDGSVHYKYKKRCSLPGNIHLERLECRVMPNGELNLEAPYRFNGELCPSSRVIPIRFLRNGGQNQEIQTESHDISIGDDIPEFHRSISIDANHSETINVQARNRNSQIHNVKIENENHLNTNCLLSPIVVPKQRQSLCSNLTE